MLHFTLDRDSKYVFMWVSGRGGQNMFIVIHSFAPIPFTSIPLPIPPPPPTGGEEPYRACWWSCNQAWCSMASSIASLSIMMKD